MIPRWSLIPAALVCLGAPVRAQSDAKQDVKQERQEIKDDRAEMQALDAKHAEAERDLSAQEKTAIDAVKADSQLSNAERKKKLAAVKKEYREKRKDVTRQFREEKKKLKADVHQDRKELRQERHEEHRENREMHQGHGGRK